MDKMQTTTRLSLVIFGMICLILPLSFIVYRLMTPSDGTRLSTGTHIFTSSGAIVSPYYPGSSVLQEGDIVVELNGKSMEAWGMDLFRLGIERPEINFGESIPYTILQNDEPLQLNVVQGRVPVQSILATHWGALLFALISQVIAIFVLIRRPGEPGALALFIWAMSGSHTYAWSFFLQSGDIVGGLGFWLFRMCTPGLWLIYWPAALHLALVFPKRLKLTQRYRYFIPALYLVSYLIFIIYLVISWSGPQDILLWLDAWVPAETLVAGLFLLATVITIVMQYRSSSTQSERGRIRLVVMAGVFAGTIGLVSWIVVPAITGFELLNPNLLGLLMLLFPLSIAVAIWRYQLFDIDIIIHRTLVYGLLTVALGILYFSSVVLFQTLFTLVSEQRSTLAIVMSTLLIAASFNPLRSRVQKFIDKRFFRNKYNAQKAVEGFGRIARDETDLEILQNSLVLVVQNAMQPESITIWLSKQAG